MERKAATARYCVRRGSSAEQNAQERVALEALFSVGRRRLLGYAGIRRRRDRGRQRQHWAHSKSPHDDRERKLESRQDAHDRGTALT